MPSVVLLANVYQSLAASEMDSLGMRPSGKSTGGRSGYETIKKHNFAMQSYFGSNSTSEH